MNIFSPEFEQSLSALIEKIVEEKLTNLSAKAKKESNKDLTDFLTRREAAQYINVCITTIHNYLKTGKIKKHRIGNRVLISKKELDSSILLIN